jgi:hypothetical protein
LNLLQFRPFAALVKWPGFSSVLRIAALAVFIALAVLGWGLYTPPGVNAKLYAKTNLVNLAIWGLWWPLMVWTAVLLGRVWCVACPLEFVSSTAENLGRKIGFTQRPLPGWLARSALVVLLFAALQMLVPGVQIHRVPHYTSIFLWTSLSIAFAVGLLFKHRAFCRGFCPVSLLLNAYGRGGMLAVRPSAATTAHLKSAPDARACPSLLNASRLNSNKDCLLCGTCIQADSANTMQFVLRLPFSKADAREPIASWPLTLFVMIVSGFVTYELCGVWKAADSVFLWFPRMLAASLPAAAAGWVQGAYTVVLVPLVLWLVLGALSVLLGGANSLGVAWRRLALPIAVVAAAGHMAKAIEKLTSWVVFLPNAFAEPAGIQTALTMHAKVVSQPTALLSPMALSCICTGILMAGVVFAMREARLAYSENVRARMVPVVLLGGFYFFLLFGWSGWVK